MNTDVSFTNILNTELWDNMNSLNPSLMSLDTELAFHFAVSRTECTHIVKIVGRNETL